MQTNSQIILLDGATGTRLWSLAEEGGTAREPVWTYNISHPEYVAQVCREYAQAGSQILCANTFGANRLAVEKVPGFTVEKTVAAGVRLAKDALAGTGVRTALDIGPLPVMMEPYGDLEEEEAEELFSEMAEAGADAGADCVFLETFLDLEMLRVAAQAAKRTGLPVFCSMSFEKSGRTMMGNSVEDMIETLAPLAPAAIGMNCSLGPALALPVIREFSEKTDLPLFFKPNAGMPVTRPDGSTLYDCGPEQFVAEVLPALELVRYVGGCCGTDPRYIRDLKAKLV